MAEAPYKVGDTIRLDGPDGRPREAVVSSVMTTDAQDSRRRWRLLCRWKGDGSFIDAPIYCGEDGDARMTGDEELRLVGQPRSVLADAVPEEGT